MDISAEKCGASGNHRLDFLTAILQTALDIVRRLVEFFTITEADRMKAGIFILRRGA
jgi:hypothetical protein